MRLMELVQQALNGTTRQLRRRFPMGFWVSTASAVGEGIFEFTPQAGPLAGGPVRLPIDQFIFPYVMARGSWQPEQHRALGRHMTANTTLVDVGANIGLYTRQMFHDYPQLRRAICIEPDAVNFALLQQNLAMHADRTRLVQAALCATTGTATLHRDPVNIGNYSLLESATGKAASTVIRTMAIAESENLILREAGAGDILYKSDTQGYDETIACGFSDAFWERVPAATLEIWQLPGKPPVDDAQLARVFAKFPYRRFMSRPDRNLDVQEIIAFAKGTSGRDEDLLLHKQQAAGLTSPAAASPLPAP